MSWVTQTDILEGRGAHRVRVLRDDKPISYAQAIELWRENSSFCAFFIGHLASTPFDAYFWETPPLTRDTSARPFEFVIVDSPGLARMAPDQDAFADHFDAADQGKDVLVFSNLGGDALLVAPYPRAQLNAYTNLAAFSRMAPSAQQHAFWQTVATNVADLLREDPLWLSTSGLGVAWLHARIDSCPKYYTFGRYKALRNQAAT